jgi:hypothetical protein
LSQWTDRWDKRQAGLGNALVSHIQKEQFMSIKTKAERDMGKSMYNLSSVAYAYYHLGCNETEAWNKALDSFIFTPDQLYERILDARRNDTVIDFLVIDDATVHFSNKLWFVNLFTSMLMDALFDTIRTAVRCLLMNCPNTKRLMDSLKSYDDYEVSIYHAGHNKYDRKAVCIKWFSLPDGHRKYHKVFEDHFSCYVPNWVYEMYSPKRKKYLDDITDRLVEMKNKFDDKKRINTSGVST